jgi:hypothetical protein
MGWGWKSEREDGCEWRLGSEVDLGEWSGPAGPARLDL